MASAIRWANDERRKLAFLVCAWCEFSPKFSFSYDGYDEGDGNGESNGDGDCFDKAHTIECSFYLLYLQPRLIHCVLLNLFAMLITILDSIPILNFHNIVEHIDNNSDQVKNLSRIFIDIPNLN